MYLMIVRMNLLSSSAILSFFESFEDNLHILESEFGDPPPADAFLMAAHDPYIKAEIVRRKNEVKQGDRGDWHKDHARFAEQNFMPWPLLVPKPLSKNL